MSILTRHLLAASLAALLFPALARADTVSLSAPQLFELADRARDQGDFPTAETAYRALSENPDIDLRNEARFRLALMLADREHKLKDAAVVLRRILDERPQAQRVRLELARVQAMMGDLGAARREMRAAQAGGLPPDVERMVRFYAAALKARKPFGGSLDVALAPDSNINRATRSNTVGTVIGDFTLDQDAKAKSGLGLALRGQTYFRMPLQKDATLLVRANGSGDLYRDERFDDILLGIQAGPEYALGADRLTLAAGPTWRWYGLKPYSTSVGASADFIHPMGKKMQGRLDLGITHTANRRNALQTGDVYSLSAGLDRAISARLGGGVQAFVNRTKARDAGWSDVTAGGSLYAFREIGRTTAVINASYSHLEADDRLFLYPRRRVDDRFSIVASTTWRALQWQGLAPITRLRWERNRSTVDIYDYRRVAAEVGITAAF